MKFIGIIPARYASSRFPGKPLAMISGRTMIERVYRRASEELDEVVVATDDSRIFDAVTAFGGKAVMTSASHRSGTDRVREAYANVGSDADVVINIQGDEPFIAPKQIAQLKTCFDDPEVEIATLARVFDKLLGFEALFNANTPKLVLDRNMNAIYFSRSIIPYVRNCSWNSGPTMPCSTPTSVSTPIAPRPSTPLPACSRHRSNSQSRSNSCGG